MSLLSHLRGDRMFCYTLRITLGASRLYDNHFTDWTISAVPSVIPGRFQYSEHGFFFFLKKQEIMVFTKLEAHGAGSQNK